MTLPTPTPPDCIAAAISAAYDKFKGKPHCRERMAQSIWDALCSEGFIRYAIGAPEELGRWIVPTFDSSNRHGADWTRVLVVPLARHNPEDAT